MQTKTQFESLSNSGTQNENLKCWNNGNNPLCLRIELSGGTEFMLPYGYFEGAKFVREGNAEILQIYFKTRQFTVRGTALGELFSAFHTLSVEWLKECPRRYEALLKDHGFVEKIEINDTA